MSAKKIVIFAILISFVNIFAEDLFFIDRGDTIFLTSENKSARTAIVTTANENSWLTTQNGFRVKVAEGIIVELKNESAANRVFSISDVKSYEKLSGNIFLVIPADANKQFELSRDFLENEEVVNSHPNLIRERKQR